jgi:hypothetical protein
MRDLDVFQAAASWRAFLKNLKEKLPDVSVK